ncbi:chemotaxis protein methyltransferase [Actinoplanes sp. NBRC 14428]|uniref:protein-glutamate O-methyltransferase n=1 Tax=Pseudosporangium ferrugineum TaxID=439699 RepID=A0A2T0RX35_9ACTN|nr:CheR family methyltransferase [Pseudosporangium ferrugineum]PRY25744.1 chemotaxis protein methyltransferase CheR [Pseudosporangium ferrugineum]BCJ56209.1 chemotaxis protein methyltransferase [Actinoplanes sp. NBRC 14428]
MLPLAASRQLTGDEFRHLTGLLREHTGIALGPGKEALVASRLDKRVRQLGLGGYADYISLLRDSHDEVELHRMIDLLTTNETFFFREPRHFEYLSAVIVPQRQPGRVLRMWSAASSTGEEAYTAAMVLAESLPAAQWEILGSDISTEVVETARRALYPIEAAGKIPPPLLRRYCLRGREEYEGLLTVSRQLRERVQFHCLNLMEDIRRLGSFDVIFLRNVMIYFDLPTKRDLVDRMQDVLVPGGHLIIGSSESLNAIPSRLRMVEPSIYRLEGAGGA